MKRYSWLILTGMLVASSLPAQRRDTAARVAPPTQPATPRDTSARARVPAPTAPVIAPAETLATLSVIVRTHDGRRVDRAVVTARPADSTSNPTLPRSAVTDPTGFFRFDSLRAGRYIVKVDSTAWPSVIEQFAVRGTTAASIVLPSMPYDGSPTWHQSLWTLLVLALYALSIVVARWHRIARPVHAMIKAQLAALRTRLETETDSTLPQVAKLVEAVKALQKQDEDDESQNRWGEYIFWSRGRENATWVAIHEIERELAAVLTPPAAVESYLRWTEAELRDIKHCTQTAVADAIAVALRADPPSDPAYRKALLGHGIKLIYAERDMAFSSLMEWHNKASWLILAALMSIVFLTGAVGHSVLFLAGAAGGYSSRLMRALKREDVPLDYGASWTTLFLSPIFGALTGWFGIALLTLISRPELNLLGPVFRIVDWNDPYGPITIGVAFLMGFSERLFDAVVHAMDKNLGAAAEPELPVVPLVVAPPAGGAASSAPPMISEIVREKRADGAAKDTLVVKGSGFVETSTATVNGTPHAIEYVSGQSVSLPLTSQDIARIDAGGDSEIVIANPGGAPSNKKNFV